MEIHLRSALSGESLGSVRLPPEAKVAELRRAAALQNLEALSSKCCSGVRVASNAQVIADASSLADAGLASGSSVDVVFVDGLADWKSAELEWREAAVPVTNRRGKSALVGMLGRDRMLFWLSTPHTAKGKGKGKNTDDGGKGNGKGKDGGDKGKGKGGDDEEEESSKGKCKDDGGKVKGKGGADDEDEDNSKGKGKGKGDGGKGKGDDEDEDNSKGKGKGKGREDDEEHADDKGKGNSKGDGGKWKCHSDGSKGGPQTVTIEDIFLVGIDEHCSKHAPHGHPSEGGEASHIGVRRLPLPLPAGTELETACFTDGVFTARVKTDAGEISIKKFRIANAHADDLGELKFEADGEGSEWDLDLKKELPCASLLRGCCDFDSAGVGNYILNISVNHELGETLVKLPGHPNAGLLEGCLGKELMIVGDENAGEDMFWKLRVVEWKDGGNVVKVVEMPTDSDMGLHGMVAGTTQSFFFVHDTEDDDEQFVLRFCTPIVMP